jgi:hypothetical protein
MKRILFSVVALVMLALPLAAQTAPPPQFPYIYLGKTGTFAVTLQANGQPYSGSFVSTVNWACNDTGVTLTPAADTLSVVVSVPITDTNTSIILTATSPAPSGPPVTFSLTIPLLSEPVTYSLLVQQTGATN